MVPGRQKTNTSIFTQTAILLSRRQLVHILTRRHFYVISLSSIDTLTHILGCRNEALVQIARFPPTSHTHKYLPIITTPKPTFVRPTISSRSKRAVHSRNPAKGSRKNRMDSHNRANGSESLLQSPRRRTRVHLFVLTSRLYRLMNAYNFSPGCSKAHCHVAYPRLTQEHLNA